MERWAIGTNSVYKTASICKEEGPWWLFFIEWLSCWAYGLFIPFRLQDWYSEKIADPIFQWVWPKYKETRCEVDLDQVADFFEPEDDDWLFDNDPIPEIVRAEHEMLEDIRVEQKKLWEKRATLVKIILEARGYGKRKI